LLSRRTDFERHRIERAEKIDLCQGMTLELAEKWALAIDLCQGMTLVVPKSAVITGL
jgi:hypothetical protein